MHPIVVIGGSAGGFVPIRRIIAALPVPCSASIFAVLHIGNRPSSLPDLLRQPGGLPVEFARDGDLIEAGHVYVAPPDYHVLLAADHIRLDQGPKVHFTRPAVDPLFISAAHHHGGRVIGIVLSGGDGDGAAGLRAVSQHGGVAIIQRPDDSQIPAMPLAALAADAPISLSPDEIGRRIAEACC